MEEIKADFDIYLTLGIILKGNAGELQRILKLIDTDFRDVTIVFTKTSAGKLMIVDGDYEKQN